MQNFAFLLEEASGGGSIWTTIGIFALIFLAMWFFMIRPQRKQERKDAEMRNALQVGDEITTIGGIIGKVVSIKEETFVLETTKDRTKIRFLRGAIRSVDVKIADVAAAAAQEAAEANEAVTVNENAPENVTSDNTDNSANTEEK